MNKPGAAARRWPKACWALATCAFVLPLLLTWGGQLYDVGMYWAWSRRLAAGALPYRDFAVEYPPLAFAGVVLPGWVATTLAGFAACFMGMMGALAAVQKGLLWQHSAQPRLFLAVLCAYESLLYATYLKRFDVLAAVVTSVALVRLVQAPHSWGGWWCLGLAAAIKLYPLLLLPLCCAYAAPRLGYVRAYLLLPWCSCVAAGSTLLLAHLACGPAAWSWLHYHHARGLHLPSSYTAAWLLLGNLAEPLAVDYRFGAMQVATAWADLWAQRATYVMGCALLLSYAALLPSLRTPRDLWRGSAAVVACLLLTAKVFSPQFMAWLVPLAAVAGVGLLAEAEGAPARQQVRLAVPPSRSDWPLLACTFAATLCTAELFPGEIGLASPSSSKRWLLVLRCGFLLALWLVCLSRPGLDTLRRCGRWLGASRSSS